MIARFAFSRLSHKPSSTRATSNRFMRINSVRSLGPVQTLSPTTLQQSENACRITRGMVSYVVMQPLESVETYKVWAVDNMVYGPIELATLVDWVQQGRVLPDTWVHVDAQSSWWRAKDLHALREHFAGVTDTVYIPRLGVVRPEELRQFPLFSGLSHDDVE